MPNTSAYITSVLPTLQAYANAAILDLTCTINRQGAGTTNGHKTGAFSAAYTGVACHLTMPSAALLAAVAEEVAALNVWDLQVAVGTDIQIGDQVVVGGQTLNVQSIRQPESYPILLHCLVNEVS